MARIASRTERSAGSSFLLEARNTLSWVGLSTFEAGCSCLERIRRRNRFHAMGMNRPSALSSASRVSSWRLEIFLDAPARPVGIHDSKHLFGCIIQQLASGFQIAIVLASDHEAMLAVDQILEQLVA